MATVANEPVEVVPPRPRRKRLRFYGALLGIAVVSLALAQWADVFSTVALVWAGIAAVSAFAVTMDRVRSASGCGRFVRFVEQMRRAFAFEPPLDGHR